jgi:hypothetical protein
VSMFLARNVMLHLARSISPAPAARTCSLFPAAVARAGLNRLRTEKSQSMRW